MQSPPVQVVSRRTVKPPPRPRERIPLTTWDLSMLCADYIQKGLLFAPPPFSTARLVGHLQAALADALAAYYPVAGRLAFDQHRDDTGHVVGCSVSVDCAGQGVEILEAVADGVAIADVIPPDVDVPRFVRSFFPLDEAVNYDGHERPLFVVQVTELADGVFVGFVYNHALSDGTAFWNFINAWARIARARLSPTGAPGALESRTAPLFERWSTDGGAAAPLVLPYADLAVLIARPTLPLPPQRERMLHFSAESLEALKERARQELLVAGDAAGAASLTRFQAMSSLLWRCFVRARCTAPDQEVVFHATANNRARLRPSLPADYFGNAVNAVSTEAVRASELLARGHGWAAAAVGRAVVAHKDADIRAHVAAWAPEPGLSAFRLFNPNGMLISSSPRFDMYGCDFGWGKALAARSGKANKYDGKVSLFPGREGGGSIDAEVVLAPEHMAALEMDEELWAAVSPDVQPTRKG
ncbi:putative acetyltransferase [Dichanthelium oligosanthes]|uniref:Putative acetyltransferase n=1 Tax=Dichanthelium oligosanthes TaxID=888268 RepID=A0A1E5UX47_9POAL|nr:putative acetyltransferase [Dichanthelium oligosanthes]